MTAGGVRTEQAVSRELMPVAVADRLHNLRTLRRLPAASRRRASLDTLVFHVPMAHQLDAPAIAAEMSDLACAALGSLDRPDAKENWDRVVSAARRTDPRWAADAIATLGGSAAIVGSDVVPEWALATGGGGLLALVAALLFRRDPRSAKRVAEVLAAWRRD
ncbi:hypothetical protein AB0368_20565 [Actinoplanes sp. NPDC051475]|uniref:hypothetical protein n=1 Tax=Actinoplanes sp. NPDC051475 TaxID=3157225 RepID=UPI00344CEDF7